VKLLQDIQIVTHCVTDLAGEINAWQKHLGYRLIEQGTLAEELCKAWDTPADTNRNYALLAPAENTDVYMRFIETPERTGYWPPVTWGWNATEILVEDPDQLAAELEDSPFERFGGPGDLYSHPKAPRAIQTYAPSGAMIYFTRITAGGSRYGLHGAKSQVDRVFNVVLGGPSLEKLRQFYSTTLGLRVGEPMPFTMTLAAQACDASPDTLFPICVAPVRARHNILELDEYPDNTQARARERGCLPGGMSMVSFGVKSLDDYPVEFRATPLRIDKAPYNGRRVSVIEGPAGEWLELIETSA
jgi:catechol 2,3-dioxygenase-like lactoylglutathione lyase family enzyme